MVWYRALIVTEEEIYFPQIMGNNTEKNWIPPCFTCQDTPCLNNNLNNLDIRLSCLYMNEHRYNKDQLDHHGHYLKQTKAMINSFSITEIKLK